MLGYAVLEVDLFRREIIRRFVSTAVAHHDSWDKGKFPLDCFLPAEYQAVANTNKVIKHSLIPAQ